MGTAINHSMSDRVKPLFVITLTLSRGSECPDVKNYNTA